MKHSAEARAVRRGAIQELALIIPIALIAMATAGTLTHRAFASLTQSAPIPPTPLSTSDPHPRAGNNRTVQSAQSWYHTWNR